MVQQISFSMVIQKFFTGLIVCVTAFVAVVGAPFVDNCRVAIAEGPAEEETTETEGSFSYRDYAAVLSEFVHAGGLVDYAGIKARPEGLARFAARMNELSETEFAAWSRDEKIAFWINAYNALTIDAVIKAYPIKAGFLSGLAYPKNSIRQIDGVWKDSVHRVMGKAYSLDHIEHSILREEFKEARIHVALVCAALSCPPLRQEPYRGEQLDAQLADQARVFLATARGLQMPKSNEGTLKVSKIFEWFGVDFLWLYPEAKDASKAVLRYVREYGPDSNEAQELLAASNEFDYLAYDWTLNEIPPKE